VKAKWNSSEALSDRQMDFLSRISGERLLTALLNIPAVGAQRLASRSVNIASFGVGGIPHRAAEDNAFSRFVVARAVQSA